MKVQKLTKTELVKHLSRIELLSFDADGTLTDGRMYIDSNGNQTRAFYAHDGMGTSMVQQLGIITVLLTTSKENVFSVRASILNCDYYIPGSFNKGEELENLCNKLNIPLENAMHVGDDINDISAFLKVGFPIAVNNAVELAKDVCIYTTELDGGNGAIREICNLIMLAKTGNNFGAPYISQEVFNKLKQ